MPRLIVGSKVTPLSLTNLRGETIAIPSTRAPLVHLQFRRFAGCPICNLHLRSVAKRHRDLVDAGVHEVAFFHSSAKDMMPFQGDLPMDVIADPDKVFYGQFGVETSLLGLMNPRGWGAAILGTLQREVPSHLTKGDEGGHLGMPADFLIARDGTLVDCKYGDHADDQWTVDEILQKARAHL